MAYYKNNCPFKIHFGSEKNQSVIVLVILYYFLVFFMRSQSNRLFSRLNNPNLLSLSLQGRWSNLLMNIMVFWICSSHSISLCWGHQSWRQHSGRGLRRAEWRGRIPSLAVLATLLLMQPRVLFARVEVFINHHTPVLLCRAAVNHLSSQPVGVSGTAAIQVRAWHLDLLDFMKFTQTHFSSLSRPLWTPG